MRTTRKTSQLQIRVTPREKAELVRRARAEGKDLSAFVLGRVLPGEHARFAELVSALARAPMSSFVLAEIHDLLASLDRAAFGAALAVRPGHELEPVSANQLAAMIETRAAQLRAAAPAWVGEIAPLQAPWFPTALMSVRMQLLCNSPAAFRCRNMFVDATVGDRV